MGTVMTDTDQRDNLAMANQMEMLTFYLTDMQLYGINVFKIIEIIECPPKITVLPHSHPAVKGTINFRGKSVTVSDLSFFLNLPPLDYKNNLCYILVCDYHSTVQGFMIHSPDTLATRNWEEIKSPSSFISKHGFISALTQGEGDTMIQILDIEKILSHIIGINEKLSDTMAEEAKSVDMSAYHILVVDDSQTARIMLQSLLDELGVTYTLMESAANAYELLVDLADKGEPIPERFAMVISDIEMPGMDGFTFTRKIKNHPKLSSLYVMLHSSLSNEANIVKAEKSGANDFLSKFNPDEIAKRVMQRIRHIQRTGADHA